MGRKYFGTDGIRGRVGQAPITAEFVLKLGWAVGRVFADLNKNKKNPRTTILIGKDTRISGYMFESALQAGLSAAGANVSLVGPMPTPAIAYLTRTLRAQAGIVISASHNPYYDNGIKFFSSQGAKLPDDIEQAIEKQLDQIMTTVESNELGKASRVVDAAGRYIEYCKSTFPRELSLRGLKIVLDCSNGATYHVAPSVFRELGADVVELACNPDGLNINDGCGSTSPETLQKTVTAEKADLGVALDGDGDRLVMVDQHGELVDGDELIYIMAMYQHETNSLNGGVAGTILTNLGLELALKEKDIPFVRTAVGDRHIIAALKEHDWQLGGEASGHIVCGNVSTTGDGIVAALQVLAALKCSGKTLTEAKQGMTKCPQVMINVEMNPPRDVSDQAQVAAAIDAAVDRLSGRGRVILRPSGTEPVVRVMVEGEDEVLVMELAQQLADVVKQAV